MGGALLLDGVALFVPIVPAGAGMFKKALSNSDELVHVYRGTSRYSEISAATSTGLMMSDDALEAFNATGSFAEACKQAKKTDKKWMKTWYGDRNAYVQAHGEFGTEMGKAFGMNRTMFSVTDNLNTAKQFAGPNGKVFEAWIPKSKLIPQTIDGAGEGESLIKFGIGGFIEYNGN